MEVRYVREGSKDNIFVYITGKGMEDISGDICKKICDAGYENYSVCVVIVEDWDGMLTPWSDKVDNRVFLGNGRKFLSELEKEVGFIKEKYERAPKVYLVGYSLAGLFSMWALFESDIFDGCVSASGSLWYSGWLEYAKIHKLKNKADIYISLGKKEPNTKNQTMKQVGINTEGTYEIIKNDINAKRTFFEWNEGGHFLDAAGRIAKGMEWILYGK